MTPTTAREGADSRRDMRIEEGEERGRGRREGEMRWREREVFLGRKGEWGLTVRLMAAFIVGRRREVAGRRKGCGV